MQRFALALLMGASTATAAAPALAGEPITRQLTVNVTDEDFASPASIAKLERRIRRAARAVCSDNDRIAPLTRAERECYARAIGQAEQRLAEVKARHAVAQGG